jgi:hypothetical protein
MVFYHALPNDLGFAYDFLTEFRRQLTLQPLKNAVVLRAFDELFTEVVNVDEFYQQALLNRANQGATFDKSSYFRGRGLSVNLTPFANMEGFSEYSIHRWLVAHSDNDAEKNNLGLNLITTFLQKLGISSDEVQKYQLLYQKYFSEKNTYSKPNITSIGRMLQIFVKPETVPQIAYASIAGGDRHSNSNLLEEINSSRSQPNTNSPSQARILLDPRVLLDSNQVRIFQYLSQPIKSEKQIQSHVDQEAAEKENRQILERYANELSGMIQADLGKLLPTQNRPHEGDFQQEPAIYRLNAYVRKDILKNDTVTSATIMNWIANHQTEKVIQYYNQHPGKRSEFLKDVTLPGKFFEDSYTFPVKLENGQPWDLPKVIHPLSIAFMFQDDRLIDYFLDHLDNETIQAVMNQLIYIDRPPGFIGQAEIMVDYPLAVLPQLETGVELSNKIIKKSIHLPEYPSLNGKKGWRLAFFRRTGARPLYRPLFEWILSNSNDETRELYIKGYLKNARILDSPFIYDQFSSKLKLGDWREYLWQLMSELKGKLYAPRISQIDVCHVEKGESDPLSHLASELRKLHFLMDDGAGKKSVIRDLLDSFFEFLSRYAKKDEVIRAIEDNVKSEIENLSEEVAAGISPDNTHKIEGLTRLKGFLIQKVEQAYLNQGRNLQYKDGNNLCRQCGSLFEKGDDFCGNCGNSILDSK